MIGWILNRSVALRISILSGVSIAGFLAILLTYMWATGEVDSGRAKADRYSEIALLEKTLESESLQIRRHEKDFLLLRDMTYADQYDASMAKARGLLGELDVLTEDVDMRASLAKIGRILPEHDRQFTKVVRAIQELGLNEEAGLQGTLRSAVHDIEDLLKTHTDDKLSVLMLMMRRHEKDFIMRLHPKYIDRVGLREGEFLTRLDEVNFPSDVKTEIRGRLASYVIAFRAYAEKRLELEGDIKVLNTIYEAAAPEFEIIQAYADRQYMAVRDEADSVADTSYSLINIIAITVIVIAIGISLVVIRATVRPIKGLEAALRQVSDGDYDVAIPGVEFGDEIGSMARVAEGLRDSAGERVRLEAEAREQAEIARQKEREESDQLAAEQRAREVRQRERAERREKREARMNYIVSTFDQSIGKAVGNLETASSSMRNTAGEMVDVSDNTGRKVNAVTEASRQMQDNVSSMASAIEQFAASISEVNTQMQSANGISREAVDASERGTEAISKLSTSSKQIEDVVKLINDIAEQTNLLALNATIEAARAGEAGKGFAVVASEVKSLANQTAKATEEITGQIHDMQFVTSTAVEVMESIGKANDRLNDVMMTVSSAVEEQQATTNEISRSVQYTSEGTQRVTAEIFEVAEGAEKTGTASANVMGASENLETLAREIKTRVDEFLGEVRSIDQAREIEQAEAAE